MSWVRHHCTLCICIFADHGHTCFSHHSRCIDASACHVRIFCVLWAPWSSAARRRVQVERGFSSSWRWDQRVVVRTSGVVVSREGRFYSGCGTLKIGSGYATKKWITGPSHRPVYMDRCFFWTFCCPCAVFGNVRQFSSEIQEKTSKCVRQVSCIYAREWLAPNVGHGC